MVPFDAVNALKSQAGGHGGQREGEWRGSSHVGVRGLSDPVMVGACLTVSGRRTRKAGGEAAVRFVTLQRRRVEVQLFFQCSDVLLKSRV